MTPDTTLRRPGSPPDDRHRPPVAVTRFPARLTLRIAQASCRPLSSPAPRQRGPPRAPVHRDEKDRAATRSSRT
jgi:hypothetical protein